MTTKETLDIVYHHAKMIGIRAATRTSAEDIAVYAELEVWRMLSRLGRLMTVWDVRVVSELIAEITDSISTEAEAAKEAGTLLLRLLEPPGWQECGPDHEVKTSGVKHDG